MYESNTGAIIIGQLLGALVGGLIGSLIGAIVLRAASKWVAKLDVPFGMAYWTVYISFIVNFILGFVVGLDPLDAKEAVSVLQIILLPVGFFIQSGIISSRLRLSFGKACLVSITMIGIFLGIVLAAGLIIFFIMLVSRLF